MGVLEFFGTLIRHDITSSAISSNFKNKMNINHFLLDFNSIIHVASQLLVKEINGNIKQILSNIYKGRAVYSPNLVEFFTKYKIQDIQNKIKPDSDPIYVVNLFKAHFDEETLDKLVISKVITNVLYLLRTYCNSRAICTLLLAIDGVPSKGKIVEQKQRRYTGAMTESYKLLLIDKYQTYINDLPDNYAIAITNEISWNRNKITPGTQFMQKLSLYLHSEKIQKILKQGRPNMSLVVSDMHEIGEGEKKIVNYVDKYLANTADTVVVYSPDADVILLCILMPIVNVHMLRHDQQAAYPNTYDIINIKLLKTNISWYINNNPKFSVEHFDIDRINRDIVCISTLFGNDFVTKIETLNVKNNFQDILDCYLNTLLWFKAKGYYLVKNPTEKIGRYRLNFSFMKKLFEGLMPTEQDYIDNNPMYNKYISFGKIKKAFPNANVNANTVVPVFNDFMSTYYNLQNKIRQNGNLISFESDNEFMTTLKLTLNLMVDGKSVNVSYLSNSQVLRELSKFWATNKKFPRLDINLNERTHSIRDKHHQLNIKRDHLNNYEIEYYQFTRMLDQYYTKLNAESLDLRPDAINNYYQTYFGIELNYDDIKLDLDSQSIMHDWVEGMVWVFEYYFNDSEYINWYYYKHERSPLLCHISAYLNMITRQDFKNITTNLTKYKVDKLTNYFNPVEQLMYVSPMTPHILNVIPPIYKKYIVDKSNHFLNTYFINIDTLTEDIYNAIDSANIDCRSIPYLNKCLLPTVHKPTHDDDISFIDAIRKVKPDNLVKKLGFSTTPDY